MKRANRAWPRRIVEIAAARPDPRAERSDPQATQKISREMLDEALKRTKSGTRPIVRSEPKLEPHPEVADAPDAEPLAGPRDDSPQVTIVAIDSVDLDVVDVSSLVRSRSASEPTPEPSAMRAPATPQPEVAVAMAVPTPLTRSRILTDRFRTTPQLAFFAGLAIVAFVTLAAVIGFFAGRISNP